jgi:cytochrome c peroxidase
MIRFAVAVAAAGMLAFAADQKTVTVQVPLGLLPLEWPKDNPYSADKVALGRLLYFDKRLSKDDTVSCASCHSPEHGYTDGAPIPKASAASTATAARPRF